MDDPSRPPVEWLPPRPRRPLSRPQQAVRGGVGFAAVVLGVVVAANALRPLEWFSAARTWEPVGRVEIAGDTWEGNLVVADSTVYLLVREDVVGFWGDLYLHRSDDGGSTWAQPVLITPGDTDAARHTLTLGSDGSLWAAWSERGPEPETQRLMLRRSRDGGQTWDVPTRASLPEVGLVGIPSLVMTDDIRLVAFTDGATGQIVVQPLDPDGRATGSPEIIGRTTRQLYWDADFHDAGLALAASGARAALVFDDGERLHLRTRDARGAGWVMILINPGSTGAAPRLVATADGFATLIPHLASGEGQLDYHVSGTVGQAWPVSAWFGPPVIAASLSRSDGDSVGAWGTCAQARCAGTRLWLADMGRGFDRPASTLVGSSSGPVGVESVGGGILVAWVEEGPSGEASERTVVLTTGPLP